MGLFDGILSSVSQHADVEGLAKKVGIDPAMAEKAIAALGASHQEPGDTVQGAAAKTGLDPAVLTHIVEQIGGEGSLGTFAREIAANPGMLEAIGSFAGGFFKKS